MRQTILQHEIKMIAPRSQIPKWGGAHRSLHEVEVSRGRRLKMNIFWRHTHHMKDLVEQNLEMGVTMVGVARHAHKTQLAYLLTDFQNFNAIRKVLLSRV